MLYERTVNERTDILTPNLACVIVQRMSGSKSDPCCTDRSISLYKYGALVLLPIFLSLVLTSCALPAQISEVIATDVPTAISPPTQTPFPTFTPIPTPTPTPIPALRIQSAESALVIGDWDTAEDEFRDALQSSDEGEIQSAAMMGLAREQFLSGNYYGAVQDIETLIQGFPNSRELPQAYFFLAQAHSSLDHYGEAAQAYQRYLELRPELIDAYVLDWKGDALFSTGDYQGAASDYQAALQYSSLLDQDWVELKMARALALSGEYQTALDLYDTVFYRTQNDHTKALINLRKGQIYQLLGQPELAAAVYTDAVNNYPTAYESYSALVELVDGGVPVDELQRGIVDYYAGQYGVALAAFDRYLQAEPADPATALYFSGLAHRASGSYETAVAQWERITQGYPDHPYWDDAWEQMAYTQWAYLDQYTLAIDNLLDFVTIASGHERSAEFLFDAALVAEIAGNLDQAAELWGRVAAFYPAYENASRARFLAGITLFRLGRYSDALANFQMLSTEAASLDNKAAAFLWIGKVQQETGDEGAARLSWEKAANLDPTGYYSERARDLMFGREPFESPKDYDLVVDWDREREQAEQWLRSKFILPENIDLTGPGPLANDPHMIRGNELWALGMYTSARNEFEALRVSVQSDPELTYRLMNHMLELGIYRSAIFAARQLLDLAGMDDASTMSAPPYFNHIRFGTYYSDLVIPIAQEYNFHPLLLFSVIRQESLFESFVRSSAEASGLMQIMPGTGADIARNMGWPADYRTEDLNRPIINLTFGAEYLDKQRNLYSGNLYTALAAYNGGPGNAREWLKLAPHDSDLYVELIRFSETRSYIQRIYEIHNLYRLLYNRTQ